MLYRNWLAVQRDAPGRVIQKVERQAPGPASHNADRAMLRVPFLNRNPSVLVSLGIRWNGEQQRARLFLWQVRTIVADRIILIGAFKPAAVFHRGLQLKIGRAS